MSACTPRCWQPVLCPVHNVNMTPRGRDAGVDAYPCCDRYRLAANRRHLWTEHDSDRAYTDPVGWSRHLAYCAECRGDE